MVFYKAKEHKVKITNEQIKRMIKEELTPSLNRIKNKLLDYSNKLFSDVQRGLRNSKETQIPKEIYIKYMRDPLYRFL